MRNITFLFIEENIGWDSFYWFFIMKITLRNKTFEWRLRLIEWRYAQAALLRTALIYPFMQDNHLKLNLSKIKFIPFFWKNFPSSFAALQLEEIFLYWAFIWSQESRFRCYYEPQIEFPQPCNSIRESYFFPLKRMQYIESRIPKQQVCHPSPMPVSLVAWIFTSQFSALVLLHRSVVFKQFRILALSTHHWC